MLIMQAATQERILCFTHVKRTSVPVLCGVHVHTVYNYYVMYTCTSIMWCTCAYKHVYECTSVIMYMFTSVQVIFGTHLSYIHMS